VIHPHDMLEHLRKAGAGRPGLAEAVAAHARILDELAQVRVPEAPPMDAAEARRRLLSGRALVPEESVLSLDVPTLAALGLRITAHGASYRPDLDAAWWPLSAWLRALDGAPGKPPTLGRVRTEWPREAAGAGVDAGLVVFVLTQALRPCLWSHARALGPHVVSLNGEWGRGLCPVCGAEPDLAALDREAGARRLLCSGCDTEWAFRRIGCPFCGSDAVGCRTGIGHPYRLAVCDGCGRYLKTLDEREAADALPLPVERVLSLGLDAQAAGG
jgi:transcription elongation factor Elf1